MGILDAPSTDFRGKPLSSFNAPRDLPGCFGWYDMAALTGAAESQPTTLRDFSGHGNDLVQAVAAKRATVKSGGPNGNKYLQFGGTHFYQRLTSVTTFMAPTYSQPNTLFLVFNATAGTTAQQNLTGGTVPGGRHNVFLNATNECTNISAGPSAATGPHGPSLADGTWHILTCILGASYWMTLLDGYVIGSGTTQVQGNEPFAGITLGAAVDGSTGFVGAIGEAIFVSGRPPLDSIDRTVQVLATKWGVS